MVELCLERSGSGVKVRDLRLLLLNVEGRTGFGLDKFKIWDYKLLMNKLFVLLNLNQCCDGGI